MAAAECGAAGDVQQQSYPIDRTFACPRSRCAPAHSRAWCARASRGRRFRVLETTRGRGIIVMYSFRVGPVGARGYRPARGCVPGRDFYLRPRAYETGFSSRTVSRCIWHTRQSCVPRVTTTLKTPGSYLLDYRFDCPGINGPDAVVRGPVGIALRSTFNRVLFLSGLIRGRQQSQVNPYADGRFDWVSRHVAGA